MGEPLTIKVLVDGVEHDAQVLDERGRPIEAEISLPRRILQAFENDLVGTMLKVAGLGLAVAVGVRIVCEHVASPTSVPAPAPSSRAQKLKRPRARRRDRKEPCPA